MKKKRSKSRTVSNVEIDNSTTNEIVVDIDHHADKYNSCNAFVLPSKKRKTKHVNKQESTTKLLSKKHRKKLEKVVERKQKKLERAKLLEELAKVQVPAAELQQYVSFTSLQNKGLKRHFRELEVPESELKPKMDENKVVAKKRRISCIKGSNKKKVLERRLAYMKNAKQNEVKRDPKITVIGFEKHNYYHESSSSDEDNTDNENKNETHISNDVSGSWIVTNKIIDENNSTKDVGDKTIPNKTQELKKDNENTVTKDAENKRIPDKNQECKKSIKDIQQPGTSTEARILATLVSLKECKKSIKDIQQPSTSTEAHTPATLVPLKECKKLIKDIPQPGTSTEARTPTTFVPLNRKPRIQTARSALPIVSQEYDIMEMINENPIVVITGETGSGKTTQVPQFLYERGYAQDKMIGITEPRRVAAMSLSQRVAEEMNLSKEVSYHIRFQKTVTEKTKIKFMTDGIMLKEIQQDFYLTQYSVVILDEVHERTVYTDVLIGLLSRIVRLRNKRNNPLKLIIMSATLRVEEILENTKLFKVKPPVFQVRARQYEVRIHFSRETSGLEDYLNDALRKTMMIHTRLPKGGILVFLTGEKEVDMVVNKLRKRFPLRKDKSRQVKSMDKTTPKEASNEENSEDDSGDTDDTDSALLEALRRHKYRRNKSQTCNLRRKNSRWENSGQKNLKLTNKFQEEIDLDDYSVIPTDQADLSDESDYLDEDDEDDLMNFTGLKTSDPMWVLPLYSNLSMREQAKVFKPPPKDCRLCVVSTNIAETSLTIPNITYIVDCGFYKFKMYDKVTGVSNFQTCYVSKASAAQRAGRAGRTGPGHCYRLYSSAVYEDFEEYNQPDILRKPIDDLLLQMKAMNISNVVNFPFPTPPDIEQLKYAEKRLAILGLLQERPHKETADYSTELTSLGHSVSSYPVAPRYGKMLLLSSQQDLLKYTICMVAALSVQQVLIDTFSMKDSVKKQKLMDIRQQWAGSNSSLLFGDVMVLLNAIISAEHAAEEDNLRAFCKENGLLLKSVVEIRNIWRQLIYEINSKMPDLQLGIYPIMPPPTEPEVELLRQIMLAGMADQVARKISPDEIKEDPANPKWKYAYKTLEMEEPIFMHSMSVLWKITPEWVVYQEVYKSNNMYMRGVTAIKPEWLPKYAPTLCRLSDPLCDPSPRYDAQTGKVMCRVTGTFGKAAWELPPCDIEHPVDEEGVLLFLYFFMNGQVCPKLKQFVPSLLSTPGSVIQIWAKLEPYVQDIRQVMMKYGIMTKDKLHETWASNKQFLLSHYQKWLPESLHNEVALIWPSLMKNAISRSYL